jgi:SAM-dependent methyltransferase
MKDMYQVTRPGWADLGKSERLFIFLASVLVGVYAGFGRDIVIRMLEPFRLTSKGQETWVSVIDTVVTTFGCWAVIRVYQMLKVRSYPSTFLYCFNLPEESNTSRRSQVIGYCHIRANKETGDIVVDGASFDWDDEDLNITSCVAYRSTEVRAVETDGGTVCQIRLDIDKRDHSRRRYRGGLLEFQLAKTVREQGRKRIDVYAGYFKSARGETEAPDLEVRSKGIAEWFCRGKSDEYDMLVVLKQRGEAMFERLDSMLSTRPLPRMWQTDDDEVYTNCWNSVVPTPQEIILNRRLRGNIDRFIEKVLSLMRGVDEQGIEDFIRIARAKARLPGNTRDYEGELKRALEGRTRYWDKYYDALMKRAEIICREIGPFLDGSSLLDIGCGDGFIANKIRGRFTRIQLLDVVDYVPKTLDLPFAKYTEGDQLPVNGSFDTVLVLNVLHHSRDPIRLLKAAWSATEKRLIVIESVVGVHESEPPVNYELLTASDADQVAYAAFVDWFYNRVLHDNIPVPYNFTSPKQWMSIFSDNGMRLKEAIHLGQDIEIGPEYHILFVLEKQAGEQTGPRLVAKPTTDAA